MLRLQRALKIYETTTFRAPHAGSALSDEVIRVQLSDGNVITINLNEIDVTSEEMLRYIKDELGSEPTEDDQKKIEAARDESYKEGKTSDSLRTWLSTLRKLSFGKVVDTALDKLMRDRVLDNLKREFAAKALILFSKSTFLHGDAS